MAEIQLTQGRVAFVDDADLPKLAGYSWYAKRFRMAAGDLWYAVADSSRVRMHRLIIDAPRGVQVDHHDGDGLNNRRVNLRLASRAQQQMNTRARVKKRSRFKGVVWCHDKGMKAGGSWQARICVNGKEMRRFAPSERAAAELYNQLAEEYFGDFARPNDLNGQRG